MLATKRSNNNTTKDALLMTLQGSADDPCLKTPGTSRSKPRALPSLSLGVCALADNVGDRRHERHCCSAALGQTPTRGLFNHRAAPNKRTRTSATLRTRWNPGVSRVKNDHTLLFEVPRAAYLLRSDFARRRIRIDGVGHGVG